MFPSFLGKEKGHCGKVGERRLRAGEEKKDAVPQFCSKGLYGSRLRKTY